MLKKHIYFKNAIKIMLYMQITLSAE